MTEREKTTLKKLSLTPEWELLKKVSEDIIEEIRSRQKLHNTEWDTMKSVIGDEAEIKGVARLIQEVHSIARQAK